jgi:hypothetical protein
MPHFIVIKANYLADLVAGGVLTFSEATDSLMADAVARGWCNDYAHGLRAENVLMSVLAGEAERARERAP